MRLLFLVLLNFAIVLPLWAAECNSLLKFNVNASKPAAKYQQNNERTFTNYATVLGDDFVELFNDPHPPLKWLDVGAGYGLATMQKVLSGEVAVATVINAQANWDFLFSLKHPPSDHYLWTRLNSLGRKLGAPQLKDTAFGSGWVDYLAGIKTKLEQAQTGDRYRYLVGFAEDVLPQVELEQNIVTDVYGAYMYSADRLSLLELYYEKLSSHGQGFVLLRSLSDEGLEVGVINKVANSNRSFEQHLVKMYPKIFRFDRVRLSDQWVTVLRMTRDSRVKVLDLNKDFTILSTELVEHENEVISQIPRVLMKLRKGSKK